MPPRSARARSWSLVCVLVLVLVAGCGSSDAPAALGPRLPGVASEPELTDLRDERPTVRALGVLRSWDRRRARAYATGEPALLRRLYAPGSRAGAKDVGILRSYAERGLLVETLATQVLEVRLLAASPGLVRLRVVERTAGGTVGAVQGHARTSLPTGTPRSRVVTLVDAGRGWVVRAVRRG